MATTLATLRDRVEAILQDTTNTKWDTDGIDEAIRQALHAYTLHLPHRGITTIDLTADGREIDISGIAYANIERIWWDYDSSAPGHPPKWRDFEVWADDTLFVNDPQEPQDGDTVRIWYTTDHTLNGLDAATETTFPDRHASVLALGASAFAASSRRVTILEELGANTWAPRNLREWAEAQLQRFYAQLTSSERDVPASTPASPLCPTSTASTKERPGNAQPILRPRHTSRYPHRSGVW